MDLTHHFTVPAPLPDAWAAFNDVETLAPCFPGATVTSAEGSDFAGSIKIKIGPLGLVYEGTGGYVERNADARRTVIQTRGVDKRGNGTAATTITATFADQGDRTEIALHTDLDLSGKPARFGREVVTDVVDRVVEQFSTTLAGKFVEGEVAAPAAPPDVPRRTLAGEDEAPAAEWAETDEIAADTEPTVELGMVPGDFDESTDGRTEIEQELDLPAPDEVVAASVPEAEPAPRPPVTTQPSEPRAYVPPQNTARPHVHVAGAMTSMLTQQLKHFGPALAIISVIIFLAIRILRRKS
jgi:carbon monoxide dehydrogenase subunit G